MSLFQRILLFPFEIVRKRFLRRKHGFFFCSRAEQAYEPGCLDSSRGKSLKSNLLRPDFLSEFAKLLSQGHRQWNISIKHPAGKFLASPDTLMYSRWLYGKGSKTCLQFLWNSFLWCLKISWCVVFLKVEMWLRSQLPWACSQHTAQCTGGSGHDMIHRSMLIMHDQQSFMAMINDHSVWSTVDHGNDQWS